MYIYNVSRSTTTSRVVIHATVYMRNVTWSTQTAVVV